MKYPYKKLEKRIGDSIYLLLFMKNRVTPINKMIKAMMINFIFFYFNVVKVMFCFSK